MKRVILCPNPYRDKGLAAAKAAEEILRRIYALDEVSGWKK